MSARTSRAPPPRNTTKPEPLIFAPRSRSNSPSCGGDLPVRTHAVATARGSPQLRTMTLFSSSPSGTSASVMFGISSRIASSCRSALGELALEPADLLAERAALRDEIVGRLAGPLAARHFLRAAHCAPPCRSSTAWISRRRSRSSPSQRSSCGPSASSASRRRIASRRSSRRSRTSRGRASVRRESSPATSER